MRSVESHGKTVEEAVAQALRRLGREREECEVTVLSEGSRGVFGIGAEHLVVGCGSVSLCQQLVQATAGPADEVIFGWRSFEAYPIITAIAGAQAVQVPLRDQVYDLPAMARAVTDRIVSRHVASLRSCRGEHATIATGVARTPCRGSDGTSGPPLGGGRP